MSHTHPEIFVLGSCLEVKKMWPGFKDDEYVIQITPSCNPVRLYCHGMNTATPREYITLQSGPERNFASFHRGRLLNFESCAGSVNPEPKLTANYWGTTRYDDRLQKHFIFKHYLFSAQGYQPFSLFKSQFCESCVLSACCLN